MAEQSRFTEFTAVDCLVASERQIAKSPLRGSGLFAFNRLAFNRLAFNRLAFNRLAFNRLAFNRLASLLQVFAYFSSSYGRPTYCSAITLRPFSLFR